MRILIVEDKPEEQMRAQEAVVGAGHDLVMSNDLQYDMDQCDGVITDLQFMPMQDWATVDELPMYGEQLPPCGLLAVIDALMANRPVVVCTSGNHHGPQMSWIYDRYRVWLKRTSSFGWNDRKDWADAVRQLEARCTD